MFNQSQWTGNYTAAGILQIEADMANFGTTALSMRIAIQGGTATCYSSNQAVDLPADGVWRAVVFELNPGSLTQVFAGPCPGSDNASTVLANVTELRILSASGAPAFIGDVVAATLGVANIVASLVPVELQSFTVE